MTPRQIMSDSVRGVGISQYILANYGSTPIIEDLGVYTNLYTSATHI